MNAKLISDEELKKMTPAELALALSRGAAMVCAIKVCTYGDPNPSLEKFQELVRLAWGALYKDPEATQPPAIGMRC